MGNTINNQQGTVFGAKVLGKITVFDLSISNKNKQTGNWESGYLKCKVSNEKLSSQLSDKTKVEVDGFLIPNQWEGKDGKKHHDINMWCTELRVKEKVTSDVMNGFESIEGDGDDLPFV